MVMVLFQMMNCLSDKDGDGVISQEEYMEWYEGGGWKAPYKDGSYYTNPRLIGVREIDGLTIERQLSIGLVTKVVTKKQ
jgi:hypothetical protein